MGCGHPGGNSTTIANSHPGKNSLYLYLQVKQHIPCHIWQGPQPHLLSLDYFLSLYLCNYLSLSLFPPCPFFPFFFLSFTIQTGKLMKLVLTLLLVLTHIDFVRQLYTMKQRQLVLFFKLCNSYAMTIWVREILINVIKFT